MPTYANTTVKAPTNSMPYALPAIALPVTEADLFNQPAPLATPLSTQFEQAICAEVILTINANVSGNTGAYVVMQGDFGDGNWFDLAWCRTVSSTVGPLYFLLSAGVAGANAIQQTRAAGTTPATNGSNQVPLPSRIRFVGQATLTGAGAAITATIIVRPLTLR